MSTPAPIDNCPTTRRFARSMVLADGAFAATAEYATAINAPEPVLIAPIDTRPTALEALAWAVGLVVGCALPAVLPWARWLA